jgi:two-component system C4-dicarboxylate transport response regulator DctD
MDAMAATLVMVVEDDAHTLSGYLELLTEAGFRARGVSNGNEALRVALEDPPAAVITDISLPGMDGFALSAALHDDARTSHLPIIGLTGHWDVEVRTKGAACGMRAVLVKPCMPGHLIGELLRLFAAANHKPH